MTWIIKFPCLLLVFLTGCSSHIPERIREEQAESVALRDVLDKVREPGVVLARWGGVISSLQVQDSQTRVTISARELNSYGEPRNNDQSPGRFVAVFSGELDDTIYRQQRLITVFGTVQVELDAGLPEVRVEEHYLWPEYRYVRHYPDPFYDPFRDYPYPMRHGLLLPYAPYRYGYDPFRYRYFPYYRYDYRYPAW